MGWTLLKLYVSYIFIGCAAEYDFCLVFDMTLFILSIFVPIYNVPPFLFTYHIRFVLIQT